MGKIGETHMASAVRIMLVTVVVGVFTIGGVDALGDASFSEPNGTEVYKNACSACHGVGGRGQSREVVGFDTPLPDFTDCSFNSREPSADWGSIAHDGGPARGFSQLMPAFGDALSSREIELAVEHIKGFCDERDSWPSGDLNLPRAFFTTKAFVEDEAVAFTSVTAGDDQQVMTKLTYETRVGKLGQVEAILPFAFLEKADSDGDWTGGIGDMVLATKWVMAHSRRNGSIFSGGLEAVLPTGRKDRGLGKEVLFFEPFLAYGQLLPLDSFVQLHVGAELSTDPDKAGHEAFWRLATGMTFAQSRGRGRAWSPMIEVLGATELEEGASPKWDVVPQLQVSLPTRQHILLCLGARIPVTDFDAGNIAGLVYVLWDWFDGPFHEGW
jgi:mono/diheme cytochrome c family protein